MDHLATKTGTPVKVLMTGAGAPGGPGIIKALQKGPIDLYTGDCNPYASGRFLNEKFIELPKADSADFIPFLTSYCKAADIQVIFPLVTRELFQFAAHKHELEKAGIKVLVSDNDALQIANDKGKLYRHLQASGVPLPEFSIVNTLNELNEAAVGLGYPKKAICIKPTVSNGSRGVRVLQEEVDEFELLFNHKPNNLYSSLEKVSSILKGKKFPELLVSDYLPGEEYTVDTIVSNGQPKLILPRVRSKMNGGISVQGTFLRNEEIITYCDRILRTLNLHGPIGLQVKADSNGAFRLLEINPRIQGTSVAALGIGINLPLLAVMQEFEEIAFQNIEIAWGRSFVRYYEELFY